MTTLTNQTRNSATNTNQTKNSAVIGIEPEPGASWMYNRTLLKYNDFSDEISGHNLYYNSSGLITETSLTNETKH